MARYSITLNFFIPGDIVDNVKKEKFPEEFILDWRKEGFFHCTLKALELSDSLPSKEHIHSLILKASKVLSNQKPFKVLIKDIGKFPDVFYAKVFSQELKQLHVKLCDIGLPSNRPQFEGKNYTPHASLVSLASPSSKKLSVHKRFGEFVVREIQLIAWDIPNGHEPKIYYRFKLKD